MQPAVREIPQITGFTDLKAWSKGHGLVQVVYRAAEIFPPDEQFGLTFQIKRTGLPVTTHRAEFLSRQTKTGTGLIKSLKSGI